MYTLRSDKVVRTKVTCELCGKEISKSNIGKHIKSHELNPDKYEPRHHVSHDDLNCIFCGRLCKNKNSLAQHETRCNSNPNRVVSVGNLVGHTAWNKGLTKYTDKRVLKNSISSGDAQRGKPKRKHTEEEKHKISIRMKAVRQENPFWHCGNNKRGYYKDYWCDSSWELAYVIYCEDHNIEVVRNTKYFPYIFNGKERSYFPDFWLPQFDTYVEVKGYMNERSLCKIQQFPSDIKLIVLQDKEMRPILEYVIDKYGKDYCDKLIA